MTERTPILELEEVHTHFPVHRGFLLRRRVGTLKAVDGVSLALAGGEVLGLVGESGCGKSTLARTILQLVPATSGRILLEGRDVTQLAPAELRRLRTRMQMVFQDPFGSLNPRMTVFDAIAEPVRVHRDVPRAGVRMEVETLLSEVGLSARDSHRYPHEFSGGQRQRIALARALAVRPQLIIADEPVSALDVSIQAQILNLLARLVREMRLSMVFISHDLSVVKHISDRVAVMYLGRIVEAGPADAVFERPAHPYTQALVSAAAVPDPELARGRRRLVLPGDPPSPLNPPRGCPFHPRCVHAIEACRQTPPPLEAKPEGRQVACLRADEIGVTPGPS